MSSNLQLLLRCLVNKRPAVSWVEWDALRMLSLSTQTKVATSTRVSKWCDWIKPCTSSLMAVVMIQIPNSKSCIKLKQLIHRRRRKRSTTRSPKLMSCPMWTPAQRLEHQLCAYKLINKIYLKFFTKFRTNSCSMAAQCTPWIVKYNADPMTELWVTTFRELRALWLKKSMRNSCTSWWTIKHFWRRITKITTRSIWELLSTFS